jgi:t-SNARE complex subunit (syntaxin)
LLGGRSSNGVTEIDVDDGTGFGGGGIPIMEDGEFQQFFDNVRQTDQRIDTELDRLHVGVTKLAESAKQITQELKVQEQIMVVTEQKMDDITTDLQKTNKKLRKAIKEVNKDKLCLYILCAIVLLGIVGAIVMMTDKK